MCNLAKYMVCWDFFVAKLRCWGEPFVLLLLRFLVAMPFLKSAATKWNYILNDQIDSLYFLFQDIYQVPLLPYKLAAWMASIGEAVLPVLLLLGFMSRFGAAGLIVMSGVIYSVDGNASAIWWAAVCLLIVTNGAGYLSVDHGLRRWFLGQQSTSSV